MKQHEKEEGSIVDLMQYRLETAKSDLNAAKILIEAEEYRASNNRAYYAIFHAILAIHALDKKSYKKHKDAIGNFNKDYVRTEIFPKEMGKKISRAEEIRHASDYDDFYLATREKSKEQIETAEELIKMVEDYCKSRINRQVPER